MFPRRGRHVGLGPQELSWLPGLRRGKCWRGSLPSCRTKRHHGRHLVVISRREACTLAAMGSRKAPIKVSPVADYLSFASSLAGRFRRVPRDLNNMVKGLLSLFPNRRVSEIIARQWAQILIQFVDERYPGRNFQVGNFRIRNSLQVFDQCAQCVAVSSNDRPAAGLEGRRQRFAPIW